MEILILVCHNLDLGPAKKIGQAHQILIVSMAKMNSKQGFALAREVIDDNENGHLSKIFT